MGKKSLEVLEFFKWSNLQLIKYLDISGAPKWVTYHYLRPISFHKGVCFKFSNSNFKSEGKINSKKIMLEER